MLGRGKMKRWLVELVGESADLEEFPRWFPNGEAYAITEGETSSSPGRPLTGLTLRTKYLKQQSKFWTNLLQ